MHGKFDTPNFLTKDAKQILFGILNTDPYKRLTIE